MRCVRSVRSRSARWAARRSAASSPSIWARRIAEAPCCGAARRFSMIQAARCASSAAAVSACDASRSARSACSRRGVGGGDGGLGGLAGGARGVLGLHGGLAGGDELLAAVALGEDALLAALRRLAHLAVAAVPDAPGAVDGDAGEAGRQLLELLDDPRVPQQPPRDREHVLVAADELRHVARAGRGRVVRRGRPGRDRVEDQHAPAVGAGGVEQRAALAHAVGERGAQLAAERGGDRALVAGRDLERVGERARAGQAAAAGGGGAGAQELVAGGELGADARGLAARGLQRACRARGARCGRSRRRRWRRRAGRGRRRPCPCPPRRRRRRPRGPPPA